MATFVAFVGFFHDWVCVYLIRLTKTNFSQVTVFCFFFNFHVQKSFVSVCGQRTVTFLPSFASLFQKTCVCVCVGVFKWWDRNVLSVPIVSDGVLFPPCSSSSSSFSSPSAVILICRSSFTAAQIAQPEVEAGKQTHAAHPSLAFGNRETEATQAAGPKHPPLIRSAKHTGGSGFLCSDLQSFTVSDPNKSRILKRLGSLIRLTLKLLHVCTRPA